MKAGLRGRRTSPGGLPDFQPVLLDRRRRKRRELRRGPELLQGIEEKLRRETVAGGVPVVVVREVEVGTAQEGFMECVEGVYDTEVVLGEDQTAGLEAGSHTLEVIVAPLAVSIPTFESFDFIVVP